jgi:hypothetical protein
MSSIHVAVTGTILYEFISVIFAKIDFEIEIDSKCFQDSPFIFRIDFLVLFHWIA